MYWEVLMKRNKGLRSFGLVTFLSLVLVFIGIGFIDGQVKTQDKPLSPPGKDKDDEVEYTWSAVIIKDSISCLQGIGDPTYPEVGTKSGWIYDSSHADIDVSNGVKVVTPKNPRQVRSYFTLEIFYPLQGLPEYQINFTNNIDDKFAEFDDSPWRDNWPPVDQNLNPDLVYKYLGFPPFAPAITDPNLGDPLKMFEFLQNYPHPLCEGVEDDYYKVRLHFSSEWADSIESGTYDLWPIGDVPENRKPMGYGGEFGNFSIEGQNMARRHCDHGDYNVWDKHNIRGDQYFIGEDVYAGWPGYIVRTGENIWKVVVAGHTFIYEEYCECVVERANKKRPLRTWLTMLRPTSGSCYMNFEMLFIRTEQ
jgi:hypothetical protein